MIATTNDIALATLIQQAATLEAVNACVCSLLDEQEQDLNPMVRHIETGCDGHYAHIIYQILDPKVLGLAQLTNKHRRYAVLAIDLNTAGSYGPHLARYRCSLAEEMDVDYPELASRWQEVASNA